jgi:rubrerythrin
MGGREGGDDMTSESNLKEAFAGESQANRRYLAFAKKADQEGKRQIARLFRAAAEAETVHAHNHLRVLGEVKTTGENLKAAVSGERYENTEMYPGFIEEAKKEGNQDAERSFDWANQVEKIHERHFQKALETLEAGKDLEDRDIMVCPVCGNTFLGDAPDPCPICKTARDRFIRIE